MPEDMQSGELTSKEIALLRPSRCDDINSQRVANAQFTIMDLAALSRQYFGRPVSNLHLSHISTGDTDRTPNEVRGWTCYKSLGDAESRKLKDWIGENCVGLLKNSGGTNEAEKKCAALATAIEPFATDPPLLAAVKYIGEKIIGALETFAIFGPALYVFGHWINKRNGHGGGEVKNEKQSPSPPVGEGWGEGEVNSASPYLETGRLEKTFIDEAIVIGGGIGLYYTARAATHAGTGLTAAWRIINAGSEIFSSGEIILTGGIL